MDIALDKVGGEPGLRERVTRAPLQRKSSMEILRAAAEDRERFVCEEKSKSRKMHTYMRSQDQILSFVASLFSAPTGDAARELEPLEPATQQQTESEDCTNGDAAMKAVSISFAANVGLFLVKVVAVVASGSLVMLASLLDSGLDLISGMVLWLCRRAATSHRPYDFPVGRSRMEPLGVVVFATIMAVSSLQIIIEASRIIHAGVDGNPPDLDFGTLVQVISGVIIGTKALLSWYCSRVEEATNSASVASYAEDHRNDVLTNGVSVICLAIAANVRNMWIIDSIGASLIAIWIINSWIATAREQVDKLVGRAVDPLLISKITILAATHHPLITQVDTVRGYYFGERCMIECHVVMPEDTPLQQSHDIGESLEIKIEALEEVGRAFVHADYEFDHKPEHRNTVL
uniref:Cation efflux protein cytoplasmic domain-containing protein n=1 Tax=Phaeomonas parva TaxID=124430 RepID=A0A7S1TUD0_9STRA|mmetsp:Transcript_17539/g.53685  ORF Transcript_17539/g.53685 Transcript_17539/m.53685 type:complete len:403 (+) Transcript_17539:215-1423(+)